MPIFRVKKDNNYSVMSNYHFKEKEMSLKAKGLLSEMFSLKEDWDYSVRGLSLINKESKNTINTILQELEKFGYLERSPVKNEKGLIIDWEYIIYEIPLKIRCPKNEDLENEDLENWDTNKILNNKVLNNKINKKKIVEKKMSEESLNGSLPTKTFQKPTISDIQLFLDSLIQEINKYNATAPQDKKKQLPTFTAEKFYYYYESVDWYVGKKKMKNWQATVRRWIYNDSSNFQNEKSKSLSRNKKEESLPDWFEEYNNYTDEMTDEEKQELDEILKSITGDVSNAKS